MKKIKKFIIFIILIYIIKTIDINYFFLNIYYPIKYEELISKYSNEYEIDKELIYAVIKNESNFKTNSVSARKAKGLMQIMDTTANELAFDLKYENGIDLFNEETNIEIGTYYLSKLLKKYKNINITLAAYNAGMGNVNKWIEAGLIKAGGSDIENIPFKETENYIRKVIRDYKIYKKIV